MSFQKATTIQPLFPNVTSINLRFNADWPLISLQSLSIFIDISKIICLNIQKNYLNEYNEKIWMDICLFMEQAHKLSSLIIGSTFKQCIVGSMMKNLYLNLPRHVKHLQIPINDLNLIKIVLERCENLSTIEFYCENSELSQNVSDWFAQNTLHTTCETHRRRVSVWLGKKNTEQTISSN